MRSSRHRRFRQHAQVQPPCSDRARNTHLADFYKSLDHLQTRADLLNHYQHVLGDPGGVARDVARYQQTTIASVRDAFARVAATHHLDLRITPQPATASDAPVTA